MGQIEDLHIFGIAIETGGNSKSSLKAGDREIGCEPSHIPAGREV